MGAKGIKNLSTDELEQLIKVYFDKMDEIMNDDGDVDECEKVYIKYIKAYEQLLFMDFDKYAEEVADAYHMFAEFYFNFTFHERKGINILNKRLEIYKKLAEKNANYLIEIGISYIELGDMYESIDCERKAEEMYELAKQIDPEKFS